MLRALDLFSGIGGITHGLRGIVTPIAYVEKNTDAREFLKQKHPDTPVFDDVCTFDATEWKGKVDIITGGWPCTGFSVAGKGTGFDHEASGLFTEVVRIAKECEPKYLFLENSHVLSTPENIRVVVDAFDKLDYDCRWMVCQATCVGALHQRKRWFCLVNKRGVDTKIYIPDVNKFDWSTCEPERQVEKYSSKNRNLLGFLGNSVVPDQIRYAFSLLVNLSTLKTKTNEKNGFSVNGKITTFKLKHQKTPPMNIVISPRNNEESFAVRCDITKILTKPVTAKYWATPTFVMRHSKSPRTLTERSAKMLSAMVAFTEGGKMGWYVNSEWVRWLMGFPDDYFKSTDY
jgi:DNA-cytosine methyltransferase